MQTGTSPQTWQIGVLQAESVEDFAASAEDLGFVELGRFAPAGVKPPFQNRKNTPAIVISARYDGLWLTWDTDKAGRTRETARLVFLWEKKAPKTPQPQGDALELEVLREETRSRKPSETPLTDPKASYFDLETGRAVDFFIRPVGHSLESSVRLVEENETGVVAPRLMPDRSVLVEGLGLHRFMQKALLTTPADEKILYRTPYDQERDGARRLLALAHARQQALEPVWFRAQARRLFARRSPEERARLVREALKRNDRQRPPPFPDTAPD